MPWIHPWGLVLSVHAALGDRGPCWPGRIAAARTRIEPRMYRMVVPVLMVVGSKRLPLWGNTVNLRPKMAKRKDVEIE